MAEEAFNRLPPQNDDCSEYHTRFIKMMKAQSMVKDIYEATEADGIKEKINKEDDNPQLLG